MNDVSSSSLDSAADELVPLKKARYAAEDPLIVNRRRKEVARLRFVEHKTEQEIAEALKNLDPPIKCSQSTISRDLHFIRRKFRDYLSVRGFDPASEVYARLQAYDEREALCMRLAREKAGPKGDKHGVAALLREANRCAWQATRLLQDVGLLDRRLGTLVIDAGDGKRAERVPSGVDLQKLFSETNVVEGEIVSEAELAWKYGDATLSTAAANAATDSAGDSDSENRRS